MRGGSPVVVRRSRIQGRGVFAKKHIAPGKKIIEYEGERLTHAEAEKLYDDERMQRHHTFLFTVDSKTVIDAAHGGNEARFINHSCEPNCVAAIEDGRVFIWSLRDIQPGDELTYDYWYSTDPMYTMEDLRRIYPCSCGASSCRGTIAGPRRPRKKKKRPAAKTTKKKKKKKVGERARTTAPPASTRRAAKKQGKRARRSAA